jgi:hypothetical protein
LQLNGTDGLLKCRTGKGINKNIQSVAREEGVVKEKELCSIFFCCSDLSETAASLIVANIVFVSPACPLLVLVTILLSCKCALEEK